MEPIPKLTLLHINENSRIVFLINKYSKKKAKLRKNIHSACDKYITFIIWIVYDPTEPMTALFVSV
jgi:hypothetical protein